MTPSINTHKFILPGVLVIAAVLLLVNLGGRDYWSDEIFSLPKMDTPKVVLAQSSFDVHPPLFFLLEYYWIQAFGRSEPATRALPALFGLLGIYVSYLIARKVIPPGNIKFYLAVLACSPFYLFYARMARYYSLTGLFTLLSIYFFLRLLEKRRFGNEILLWLSALLLIYTDYVGFIILGCLGLYYLWSYRRTPNMWFRFILGGFIILGLYLPWISNLTAGAGAGTAPYPVEGELEREGARIIGFIAYNGIQSVIRIVYTLYDFTFGETVYPWNPAIALGAAGALLLFILSFKEGGGGVYGFWGFALILPFGLYILAVVFYSKVFSASNFALLPSKIYFLQPLWLMFLLKGDNGRAPFKTGVILLLIFNVVSLVNYHRGAQFLNPKYVVPWEQAATEIEADFQPGDLAVTDESPLLHYLGRKQVKCYGLVGAVDFISEQERPMAVKLAVRHRGEESIYLEGMKVRDQLTEIYGEPEYKGYVPLKGIQQKLWSRIQGREVEDYLMVFTFDID